MRQVVGRWKVTKMNQNKKKGRSAGLNLILWDSEEPLSYA
jgi:hypothetical protein